MFTAINSPDSRPLPPASHRRQLPPLGESPLSPREHEALELIARGFSYVEIARLQRVSVHTTRSHIKNVYIKLDVHSRSEAVYEATAMGLLQSITAPMYYHDRRTSPHDCSTDTPQPSADAACLFDCP